MVELVLPLPPSVNDLWEYSRKGGAVYKSKKYESWIRNAGWELKLQKPQPVKGPYTIYIEAQRPDNRRRDLGNLEKAVSDLLQAHRVIENDCLAESIILRWRGKGNQITIDIREWKDAG